MQKLLFSIFLTLLFIIGSTHSEQEKFLHVYNDNLSENNSPIVISNSNKDLVETLHSRYRRDLPSDRNEGLRNISTRVSLLTFSPYQKKSLSYYDKIRSSKKHQ